MIKKWVIKSKEEYEKDGDKKNAWRDVGEMIEFDNGNKIMKLNLLPNQQFSLFPIEKQANGNQDIEANVDVGDLPF